jgi:outer membrane receptor protein involved in Fe transport
MSSFGLDMSVDAYCHYVRDKIVAIPTLFVWKMYNLGRALSAGADLSLRYSHRFHPSVAAALQAKYSYQYTADITDPHKKSYGLPLPYTPAHSAGATLSVLTRWVNFNYSFDALSERYAQAQPLESAKLSPYMVHSLSINRKFVFRYFQLHLSAALNNIGDESYELVKNYPMPGRNFKLSVRIVL